MKPIKGHGKRNKRNPWKKKKKKKENTVQNRGEGKKKKRNNFIHFDEKSSQGFFEFTDLELISRRLNAD